MLGEIEVNWMLVLGLIVLSISATVTLIAGHKHQNSARQYSSLSGVNSQVGSIMSIASFLTFVAMIPLTMYLVNIAFNELLQRLIVGFILISVVAGFNTVRTTIQMTSAVVLSLPLTIIQIAIAIIKYPFQKLTNQ